MEYGERLKVLSQIMEELSLPQILEELAEVAKNQNRMVTLYQLVRILKDYGIK